MLANLKYTIITHHKAWMLRVTKDNQWSTFQPLTPSTTYWFKTAIKCFLTSQSLLLPTWEVVAKRGWLLRVNNRDQGQPMMHLPTCMSPCANPRTSTCCLIWLVEPVRLWICNNQIYTKILITSSHPENRQKTRL